MNQTETDRNRQKCKETDKIQQKEQKLTETDRNTQKRTKKLQKQTEKARNG